METIFYRRCIKIKTDILPINNESIDDYAFRLYRNQVLLELTNKDVGDLLNSYSGEDKDESAWRKLYKRSVQSYDDGFMEGYNRGLSENSEVNINSLALEIQEKRDELYKITQQVRDQNREKRNLLRFEARSENLIGAVRDTAIDMSIEYPLLNPDPIVPITDRVGILLLSDWHYGEVIDDFTNKYNHEVFMERIDKLTIKTIKYIKLMNITEIKVLNLGDLISGDIHVSTRVNNEEDLISQVMLVSEVIGQMLSELSQHTNIEFYTVTDNHSRTNKSKVEHIEIENYQRIIPFYLEQRMRDNKNVKIIDMNMQDPEIGMVDIMGETALFTHGHHDRPNAVTDLITMTKVFPIAVFMGHYHHHFEREDNETDLIGNPSLIGSGGYSKTLRKTSKARQKFIVYNKVNNEVGLEGVFHIDMR